MLILAHLTAVKGRNYDFVKLKEQTLFGHWGLPYSTCTFSAELTGAHSLQ